MPDAAESLRVLVHELTTPEDRHRWAPVLAELIQLPDIAVAEAAATARHREGHRHAPWAYTLKCAKTAAHGMRASAVDRVRFLRRQGLTDAQLRDLGFDPALVPARPAAPASKTTEVDDDW